MRDYVARYGSQNKAAASLKGVSAATLSAMLNGRTEVISDEMWRGVREQVSPASSKGWRVVETGAFQEITAALADAQEWRGVRWIVGEAGCGKTTAATAYAREHRDVFVVGCDEDMRKSDFVREIARRTGVRNTGLRIREMLETVIGRLTEMESPLLIFDEGDKLNDNVFHYFINIYNHLEGRCGIVFMSTSYIERRLERGVAGNRKGYSEIWSRIGRRFFELEPTGVADVAAVCRANGVTEKRELNEIVKATERHDYDLRSVRSAVHRVKMMRES